MKTFFSHLLRVSVFTVIAALGLLCITATTASAHAGYARQTNFHQLIPEQALPGGGGHGSGGHSSSGHSSSSHSTSSHDTSTDSVSSDSSSSSSSHYSNTHTYTQYNTSSGSGSLDWPTCLTLLVIGAIVLLISMAWKRRNN